jgi:hypothetical protein
MPKVTGKKTGFGRFNAEQCSQFQGFLAKVREYGDSQEADDVDEDEDLHMERGNELAPNRTCPLCQKEVSDRVQIRMRSASIGCF